MNLGELGKEELDVVERVRTIGVTCHLHALPGREASVDAGAQVGQPPAQALELAIALGRVRQALECLDLAPECGERFFEIKQIRWHLCV